LQGRQAQGDKGSVMLSGVEAYGLPFDSAQGDEGSVMLSGVEAFDHLKLFCIFFRCSTYDFKYVKLYPEY